MKHLHPYLYEIIHDLVQKRMAEKKVPYVAIANEVMATVRADVLASLDEMEDEGLITHSQNVNGIALYRTLKQKEDENNNVQR